MTPRAPVSFEPAGVTAWVAAGSTVLEAARKAGIIIPAPCGGRGVCGKCAVRVVEGEAEPPDSAEEAGLKAAPSGLRFACRMTVSSPITVRPLVAQNARPVPLGIEEGGDRLLAAVDLGTTSVSAVVVGASSGRELGRSSAPNAQQSFGADILSRISAALSEEGETLRRLAEDSILESLDDACGRAGACLAAVDRLVIVGNTAMLALLSRADVSSLAAAPFAVPESLGTELGVDSAIRPLLAQGASVEVVPPLGSFVGSDVAAGLLAAGLLDSADGAVYIDIGTNAEIVALQKRAAVLASAPAGPAFEGYGIASGGPAVAGAIVRVRISEDLELDVLGDGPPRWLSGSGLVSAVAALRRSGHIARDGALGDEGPLAARVSVDEDGVTRIALGPDDGAPFLTQLDIRAFQTAKAAVASGVLAVCRASRLKARQIRECVVAGTFGGALDVTDLAELGIVPEELRERTHVVADAALLGAATLAFDPGSTAAVAALREAAEHLELATDQSFLDSFVPATILEPFTIKKGLK